MAVNSDNPLIDEIHTPRIERPDMLRPRDNTFLPQKKARAAKRDWHPVGMALAKMGALLAQYGHHWNKGEKLIYRRAILSVTHPCCPTCGKPMNESAVTHEGKVHKSWFCLVDQNL